MTKDLKQLRDELHWEMYKAIVAAVLSTDPLEGLDVQDMYEDSERAVRVFLDGGVE